jgi:hypothetical protein
MPVVDVVNLDGKKVGQVELADAVFGAKVNPHLLHEASRWYLRGLRAGTHKTKDKSEVSGAGRKLWRQKGTGRASAPFVLPSGAMAARCTAPSRAITVTRCRRKCSWARCARRFPRSSRNRN